MRPGLKLSALAFLIGSVFGGAVAWALLRFREPATYEDCILRGISAGMSNRAIVLRERACKALRAAAVPVGVRMDEATVAKIGGKLALSANGDASGRFFNGSDRWVTKLSIGIGPELAEGEALEPGRAAVYEVPASIAPSTAADISFSVASTHFDLKFVYPANQAKYTWMLMSADGVDPVSLR